MAGVKGKDRRRVWIDSQTQEEIIRGINEAKDLSEYDALSDSAYLRAQEDMIPACESTSLEFCMMYSTYNLYKQGDYTHP